MKGFSFKRIALKADVLQDRNRHCFRVANVLVSVSPEMVQGGAMKGLITAFLFLFFYFFAFLFCFCCCCCCCCCCFIYIYTNIYNNVVQCIVVLLVFVRCARGLLPPLQARHVAKKSKPSGKAPTRVSQVIP